MAGTAAGAKKAAATRKARRYLAAKHGGYLPGAGAKARKKAPAKVKAAPTPAKPRKSKSGYDEWRTELHKLQESLSRQPADFRFTTALTRLDRHLEKHRNYAARLSREIKAGTAKVFGQED